MAIAKDSATRSSSTSSSISQKRSRTRSPRSKKRRSRQQSVPPFWILNSEFWILLLCLPSHSRIRHDSQREKQRHRAERRHERDPRHLAAENGEHHDGDQQD